MSVFLYALRGDTRPGLLHCAAAAILYCTILYSIRYIVNSIHFMICSYVYMLDQLHEIICRLILHYMW